ncbi:2466_t:CDS:2, partial [Acaulospora morrowiae]
FALLIMGAQGSKQIQRKLPKHVVSEVKSSALESHLTRNSGNNLTHNVSTTRNEVIEEDGKDPHLLDNLTKIGQVTLPKDRLTFKQSEEISKIFRNRQAENTSNRETLPRNRVSVQDLRDMLNKRNSFPNEWTLEKLSSEYNLDPQTIQILLKHINTYTIERGTNTIASWPDSPEKK